MDPIGHLQTIDLTALQRAVTEPYANVVVSTMNDHCVRLAVITGEYRWHRHPLSDEVFLALDGELLVDFTDRESVALAPHTVFTIPAGVAHRTRALRRTVNLCFERTTATTEFLDE